MSENNTDTIDVTAYLWRYTPSLALSVIALVLFGVSALWHIQQAIKYRQKIFVFFVLGCILQVAGYISRIGCRYDLQGLGVYIAMTLFLLLAPIFYAVSMYSLLGKIIDYIGANQLSPITPTRITWIFVIGDIISLIMQSTGGAMLASGNADDTDQGTAIVLVGLGIQLGFFAFFLLLMGVFHYKTRGWEVKTSQGNWKLLLGVLEVTSGLILARSIYRIVEYAEGYDGYLISHEVYLYTLDALLMLFVQLLWKLVHPGPVLKVENEGKVDVEMAKN